MDGGEDGDEPLLAQAVAWHEALRSDGADWDGFLAWLETDHRNREAYDRVALVDRVLDDRRTALEGSTSSASAYGSRRSTPRRWVVGAICVAAGAAGVALLLPVDRHGSDRVFETAGGVTRRIALGDGVSVELASGSRLVARRGDATRLELERGEALFAVRHDPARPVEVRAGGLLVRDVGTRFGVDLAPGWVTVAVAQGSVTAGPPTVSPVSIVAGRQLTARRGGGEARMADVASGEVGSWRSGRLVYVDAPLGLVVGDVARYTAGRVVLDPALRDRRFSGVLIVGRDAEPVRDLADLMGLHRRVEDGEVRLSAPAGR